MPGIVPVEALDSSLFDGLLKPIARATEGFPVRIPLGNTGLLNGSSEITDSGVGQSQVRLWAARNARDPIRILSKQAMMPERRICSMHSKLILALAFVAGLTGGMVSPYLLQTSAHAQVQPDKDGILRVRGVIVEDENKIERVRLGAPLPDPMIHGVRYKRNAAISGLLISDAEGNERGGYVTSDKYGEAFFTLDSEDEQRVLFLANPKGGVHLDLFDSKGNEASISVFPDGPKLTLTKAKNKVLELPK